MKTFVREALCWRLRFARSYKKGKAAIFCTRAKPGCARDRYQKAASFYE